MKQLAPKLHLGQFTKCFLFANRITVMYPCKVLLFSTMESFFLDTDCRMLHISNTMCRQMMAFWNQTLYLRCFAREQGVKALDHTDFAKAAAGSVCERMWTLQSVNTVSTWKQSLQGWSILLFSKQRIKHFSYRAFIMRFFPGINQSTCR